MTTSQPIGLARSRPRRVRGCRCSHAASRLGAEGRGDGKSRAVLDKRTDPLATWWPRGGDAAGPFRSVCRRRYPARMPVQASTQAAKSLQVTSVRPSRHLAVGVVQYQTSFQYSVSSAWKMSQWSGFTASAHDFELPGASPKYSAIWMLTGADVMWFTNLYAQLMFLVF